MDYCLMCGKYLNELINYANLFRINNNILCKDCIKHFEKVNNGCVRCGKKTAEVICGDCEYWEKCQETRMFTIKNHSLFYYNDFAKKLIQKIKFLGDAKLLLIFKEWIRYYIKHNNLIDYYLVPVPLHEERLSERGFNQSLFIARMINLPILDIIFKLNNDRQSKKKKAERMMFDNQYQLRDNIDVSNKKVMIVDDIYTTGATIHKIGRLLYDNNIKEMISFTVFRS